MTAGLELIKKIDDDSEGAYVMTVPLLTTAKGAKFGKSEGNAIWLDERMTTQYELE